MMLTAGGIDAVWYVLVALVLSRGPVLAWLKAKSFVIDKVSGLVLLGWPWWCSDPILYFAVILSGIKAGRVQCHRVAPICCPP